jgi:phosphohistidine phosphatase
VGIDRIVHSGKTRAEQSAHLLAGALGCSTVEQHLGLRPGDDVGEAASSLIDVGTAGSLGIVGHLPFLDRLAALLVAGDPGAHVVAFRNGGLVRLVPGERGYAVSWVLVPELAG